MGRRWKGKVLLGSFPNPGREGSGEDGRLGGIGKGFPETYYTVCRTIIPRHSYLDKEVLLVNTQRHSMVWTNFVYGPGFKSNLNFGYYVFLMEY